MVPYLELWRFYAHEKCHIQHLTTGYEDVPGSYYLFADPSLGGSHRLFIDGITEPTKYC